MSLQDILPVGSEAPDFAATTSHQKTIKLSDHRRKESVVLVFYPGDNTPVCTAQLCAFRDQYEAVLNHHAAIYGVNPSSVEKHIGFAKKHDYPFPLISDSGSKIAKTYGCSAIFGLLIKRTVYVIDPQGIVRYAQRGDPPVSEIIAALEAIENQKL